jgi:uncharacterized membrane protein
LESQTYNAWRLISLSPLPRWALALTLATIAAAWLWTAARVRRERRWLRRTVLLVIRALSALVLAGLLLEPGILKMQTARIKSRFLILLDHSRSMGLPAGSGGTGTPNPTRAEAAARWAKENGPSLADLARRFQLEVSSFAEETEPLDLDRLAVSQPASGKRTDILGALQGAARGAGTETRALAGVLVISDGADNLQLARGVQAAETEQLEALHAPVNTLAVGAPGVKDLAVSALQVDDFAFVRNPMALEVTLRNQGFAGERVPVTLMRGNQVAASQTATLESSGVTKVRLTFTPDQTGEFVYTVSVPVLTGEAVADNNQRAFVLKVIRDRVRVLLVCGHPSWDERFLRGLLRQDPNVDLVSFFILRDQIDTLRAREDELSLIPFPTEEIFRDQLHSFDLVILQNFGFKPLATTNLRIESYFPDIRQYVEEGGALLMIGGENSFGEGQYDETELGMVLPVSGAGVPPSEDRFHPQLTDEGRRHPVTQLAESGELSARLWSALPAVTGLNLVRAKPNARVLLSHPLLSVADEGRGRSMALMIDSSWRWSLTAAGQGLGNRYYERFFTNAVRWLVRDPELTPVKLATPKQTIEPGEPAQFDVQAREADYGPAPGAQVSLVIYDAATSKELVREQAATGQDGSARLEVPNLSPGAYRAVTNVKKGDADLGSAEQAIAVRENGPETDDPLPHPELLARIATATGGTHATVADGFPKLKTVHETQEVEIGRRKEEPLWDNAVPLAVLAFLLSTEWLLRRRWGLP